MYIRHGDPRVGGNSLVHNRNADNIANSGRNVASSLYKTAIPRGDNWSFAPARNAACHWYNRTRGHIVRSRENSATNPSPTTGKHAIAIRPNPPAATIDNATGPTRSRH